MSKIPKVTHLQCEVLRLLIDGCELSGCRLREGLRKAGFVKSSPAFYQLMARLEDAKYVAGTYETDIVEGYHVRRKNYRITIGGRRVANEVRKFYEKRLASLALDT